MDSLCIPEAIDLRYSQQDKNIQKRIAGEQVMLLCDGKRHAPLSLTSKYSLTE